MGLPGLGFFSQTTEYFAIVSLGLESQTNREEFSKCVNGQRSTVNGQRSTVNGQRSTDAITSKPIRFLSLSAVVLASLVGTALAENLPAIDPEIAAEITRNGAARVSFLIFDREINKPWRGRHQLDASAEVAELERLLREQEADVLSAQRASNRVVVVPSLDPIRGLQLRAKGGFGAAVIDHAGLQILAAQPLITVVSLDRGLPFAQAITDFEEAARTDFTQSADLVISHNPSLTGQGVEVVVFDGNIDTAHPAISANAPPNIGPVVHERCYTDPNAAAKHLCGHDPAVPGSGAASAFGPGVAKGPLDYDWAHGTGVTGLIVGRRQPATGVPTPPYLGAAKGAWVTAIRVTSQTTASRSGPGDHAVAMQSLSDAVFDWVVPQVQSGARPYVAANMSFGFGFDQDAEENYNAYYTHRSCDRMLQDPTFIDANLVKALAATRSLRDHGVLPFAATGNLYSYQQSLGPSQRNSRRNPNFPACLSPVIGVGATWDTNQSSPGVTATSSGGTSACDASPNRNACYGQRNRDTKLTAPGSRILAPWMTYVAGGTPIDPVLLPSYVTNEVWGTTNNSHISEHGTSFSAPLALSCYAQMVERYQASMPGFPGLDRRDLITNLIVSGGRSARVLLNGQADGEDVEVPLVRCAQAISYTQFKIALGSNFGLPIQDRFTMGGAWNAVSQSGQGFVLEVNPYPSTTVPLVFGGWFTYAPTGGSGVTGQRWVVLQSKSNLLASASTIELDMFQVDGGAFLKPTSEVPATLVTIGSARLRFHNCVEATLEFGVSNSASVIGQHGTQRIRLTRTQPTHRCHEHDAVQAEIAAEPNDNWEQGIRHFGRNGAWAVPGMLGQGLVIEQNPNFDLPFVAWYTFTPSSPGSTPQAERLRWFTLQPNISQQSLRATTATFPGDAPRIRLKIIQNTGGVFNTPSSSTELHVGDATLTAVDGDASGPCNELEFRYKFFANAGEFANLPLTSSGVDNTPPIRFLKPGAVHPACSGP
jgi:hypothetical protein